MSFRKNESVFSSFGNIKSLKFGKEKILKNSVDAAGYAHVNLCKNGRPKPYYVHKLVAIMFLGYKPNGHKVIIDHIDNDKLNNHASNLQIITNRENCNLKHIKSSSKYTGVSFNKRNKKWVSSIQINGKTKYLGLFINEIDASNIYQKELKKISCNT